MTTDLRYPIGKFQAPADYTQEVLNEWIGQVARFPARLRAETADLTEEQLDTPYREEGWTVRQVVHHLADSHMNSWIRFKLALTEEQPTIKAYEEKLWAEQPDSSRCPLEPSLVLLDALHERWAYLLRGMSGEQFERTFIHPASGAAVSLKRNLGIYAWHGDHHLAQITALKQRMNW